MRHEAKRLEHYKSHIRKYVSQKPIHQPTMKQGEICKAFTTSYDPSEPYIASSSTLPLRKNAPPRTSIRKHKSPPRTPLSDLDNRLPRTAIAIAGTTHMLALAR